jgi:hypothetical protein
VNWCSPLTRKCILPFNITSNRCSAHLASTRHVVITGTESYFPCPPCSSTTMTVLKFVERLSTVQIRFWTQPGMVSDPPPSETLGGARHKSSCFICISTSSSHSVSGKQKYLRHATGNKTSFLPSRKCSTNCAINQSVQKAYWLP